MPVITLGVGVGIAAGCAFVASGSVLLYCFRKEIKALLKKLKTWVISACRYLIQLARDILFNLYRATEDIIWSAYQATEKGWKSSTPEGRKMVLSASVSAVRSGVEAATEFTRGSLPLFSDPNSHERKAMNAMFSKIGSIVGEFQKSVTEMCKKLS